MRENMELLSRGFEEMSGKSFCESQALKLIELDMDVQICFYHHHLSTCINSFRTKSMFGLVEMIPLHWYRTRYEQKQNDSDKDANKRVDYCKR